mgnify:CR=1 FL=1
MIITWINMNDSIVTVLMKTIKVIFFWKYSYVEPILLYGSFNNWTIGTEMNFDEETSSMKCQLNLPPGTYEYKFKVGNNWYYDILLPNITDNDGNINNLIKVAQE